MAAGRTYTPIATYTASGSSNNISFSSVPSTYTDLVLVISGRSTVAASTTQAIMVLNGDATGTSYSNTLLKGNGSAASSSRNSNYAQLYFMNDIPGVSATGNYFSVVNVSFQNYSNTTTYKTIIARNAAPSDSTDALVGLWRSTAAINSISISAVSGNWVSGSTFTLYGIAAA